MARNSLNLSEFALSNDQLTIVTFNYDRSLEYYIFNALQRTYPKTNPNEHRAQLNALNIFHVYGHLGNFETLDAENNIPYGFKADYRILKKRAENIKLISEDREAQNPDLNKIKIASENAKYIFFLGFSFDQENLEKMGFPITTKIMTKISGSTFGMKRAEISNAQELAYCNTPADPCRRFINFPDNTYDFFRSEVKKAF
jgi:hypothetical protein